MLGLPKYTFLASSTASNYPIWWPQNRKFIFSSCFYVRQAQFTFCSVTKYILLTKSVFSGSENLIAPSKRLLRPYFETGSDKFKMALAKTGCTCISASIQDSEEIPTANHIFLGLENSMALLGRLHFETGSQKI
jgi:hypothetical protein